MPVYSLPSLIFFTVLLFSFILFTVISPSSYSITSPFSVSLSSLWFFLLFFHFTLSSSSFIPFPLLSLPLPFSSLHSSLLPKLSFLFSVNTAISPPPSYLISNCSFNFLLTHSYLSFLYLFFPLLFPFRFCLLHSLPGSLTSLALQSGPRVGAQDVNKSITFPFILEWLPSPLPSPLPFPSLHSSALCFISLFFLPPPLSPHLLPSLCFY